MGYSRLSVVLSVLPHFGWILSDCHARTTSALDRVASREQRIPFLEIWIHIRKLACIFNEVVTGANLRSTERDANSYESLASYHSKSNGPSKIRGDTIPHPRTCVPRVLKNRRTRERSFAAVNFSDISRQTEVSIEGKSKMSVVRATKIFSSVGNSF